MLDNVEHRFTLQKYPHQNGKVHLSENEIFHILQKVFQHEKKYVKKANN